ncbi:AraC family transcriptional regulator [Horticoccus luteus]|uniref:AraC family transcriptional regulator n=1 Tax=Horticoccus luteus TaxID=2862869 RepID=A0A8F9XM86_9BACT|nr:AraC family transcriptional regulator [Horticoccus luteus]QYM79991.1 AraC family transcriptional regulator [Horticoccus luteus]
MGERCAHFRLADYLRGDDAYHFADAQLTARSGARYHDHDFHEIFWVTAGAGRHRCNGRTEAIVAGQMLLMRPKDRHCVQGTARERLRIVNVAFPSRRWSEVRRKYFADHPDPFESSERHAWRIDEVRGRALHRWSERLGSGGRTPRLIDGFLMDLPDLLGAGAATEEREMAPAWLTEARQALAAPENFSGGTPALARLAGRSPSHVARATVRWFGVTPTELVNDARMEFSARQLATTRQPIVEIALDCGLNNLSHFYALFRRRHGISPRRYRLRAHGIV